MTEQPSLWLYSTTGNFRWAVLQPVAGLKQCRPSITRQP